MSAQNKFRPKIILLICAVVAFLLLVIPAVRAQVTNPQTGSVGLEGTVPTEPPQVGATISFPVDGQVFDSIPITVEGICPAGLLVKIFVNQIFVGSASCTSSGNFSLQIDLFSGRNDIVARVYDSLDQPGPDSNTVTVTYNSGIEEDDDIAQMILSSTYALRGADAGAELTWPLALSGGLAPYAITVNWGDGQISQFPLDEAGNFTAEHVYFEPGVYEVVVKAVDSRGRTAFLQLVAVANGEIAQDQIDSDETGGTTTSLPAWPFYVTFTFTIISFWLGRSFEKRRIKEIAKSGKSVKL